MYKEDINSAKKVRLNSYSPYSNFQIGATLRTKSGKTYLGCNVENHGIQSVCAERTAFLKALSEGEKEFECITIVGANKGEEPHEKCMPCGYCRQFMSEFVDENFKVWVVGNDNKIEEYTITELLPYGFKLESCQ